MVIQLEEIENYTDAARSKYLRKLVRELDKLDLDDFFGSEGWRHFMGFED